jgi:hypothetical protein
MGQTLWSRWVGMVKEGGVVKWMVAAMVAAEVTG